MTGVEVDKILVIRGGGLGDFILILPLLRALRQSNPKAVIQILGHKGIAQLAVDCHLADLVLSLESAEVSLLFQDSAISGPDLPLFDKLKGTDQVFSFLGCAGGQFHHNLGMFTSQIVWISAPIQTGVHAAQHFLNQAKLDRLNLADLDVQLEVSLEYQKQAKDFLNQHFDSTTPVIAIHPGSGSAKKNWPFSNYAQLVKKIESLGIKVLLIEGEADRGIVESLKNEVGKELPTASHKPLPILAGILKYCHFLIGNDSGISHLAGITGIPVLALFGPTDPTIWKSLGQNVEVMRFEVATVARIVERIVPPNRSG